MKKVILYIAMSLNGKIARKNGSVDWLESLPNPEKTDYGYNDFVKTIDTTIMGNSTYQQLMSWGIEFPYAGKKNYVFTKNTTLENTEYVDFVSENHIDFVCKLKQQEGNDIWLIGGGKINTFLFNANLIDEIRIFIMPVVIPDGINLFESAPIEKILMPPKIKSYSSGAVELIYELNVEN